MDISNANVLEIVKDKARITITMKYEMIMDFRLANLHLMLTNSKGQGQGHVHFDDKYLENCDI